MSLPDPPVKFRGGFFNIRCVKEVYFIRNSNCLECLGMYYFLEYLHSEHASHTDNLIHWNHRVIPSNVNKSGIFRLFPVIFQPCRIWLIIQVVYDPDPWNYLLSLKYTIFLLLVLSLFFKVTITSIHDISFGRILSFIFSEPYKRISLCIYWVCVIYVSVLRFYNISKNSKIERILLRKYYHLMAVSMFLPALIFQVI